MIANDQVAKQLIVADSYRTLTDTNKTSHANVVRASSEYTPACATAQSDHLRCLLCGFLVVCVTGHTNREDSDRSAHALSDLNRCC